MTGIVHASTSLDSKEVPYVSYETSNQGILNLSVEINNQSILIFNAIKFNGNLEHEQPDDNFYIGNNKMTPFIWVGSGSIHFNVNINVSRIENFSYSGQNFSYIYIRSASYLGMLFTNGNASTERGNITISGGNISEQIAVVYFTSPVSYCECPSGNYTLTKEGYLGNYSSFSYRGLGIENYSVFNSLSSVSLFSYIGSASNSLPSLANQFSDLISSERIAIYPVDGISPFVFISSEGAPLNISLNNEFRLVRSGSPSVWYDQEYERSALETFTKSFNEQIYKIVSGNSSLGSIDVYGNAQVLNNSTIYLDSPLSFVVIRLTPVTLSPDYSLLSGKLSSGINSEIYVGNKQYFIPLSTNVTLKGLTYENGTLNFLFTQTATANFLIIFQGNYSVDNVTTTDVNSSGNVSLSFFSLVRGDNETLVYVSVAGNGTSYLTLSVIPFVVVNSPSMMWLLPVVSIVLIFSAFFLIFYARKRSLNLLEKE